MPCFSSTQHKSGPPLPQPFRQTKIDRLLLKKKKMIGGTLTSSSSSSTKFILDDSPTWILRRGGAGAEIFPCVVPKKTFLRIDSSVRSKILKPMIPLRASSSEEVNIEEDAETEAEAVEKSPGRTVRVRFQLRKECIFGEHFFILGEHPVFGGGLWDPENALPLNWSDGHVWTLDLDLPVGRLVEFKFILKAETGEILWQPGPNRAIKTWETNKTIIRICEDWENADLQMMREEAFVPLLNQEQKQSSFSLDDMPLVSENITYPEQSVALLTNASSNGAGEEVQVLGTVHQISSVVAVDDEPEESSSGAMTACQNENVTQEAAMFTEEESPVLVPGLFSLTDLDNEEVSGTITQVSVEVINEGKAEKFPEVDKKQEIKEERNDKGKVKAVSLFEDSEQEAVKGVEKTHYNAEEEEIQPEAEALLGTPHVLLEKDIQWGRRKIYKLLSNFGLF